jgi:hypothetical protein
MKKSTIPLGLLLVSFIFVGTANAVPLQWPVNGHLYEAVLASSGIDWNTAKAAADAKGGYLATANTANENSFIFSLITDTSFWYNDPSNSVGPWLGGYYVGASGTMNSTDWRWLDGELFSFTNWEIGEPNYVGETVLHYYGTGQDNIQYTWNNIAPSNPFLMGYVIEWNANPVPLPSAILLLGAGLGSLAIYRRRKLTAKN